MNWSLNKNHCKKTRHSLGPFGAPPNVSGEYFFHTWGSGGHVFLAAGADGGLEQSGGEYFQDCQGLCGCFQNLGVSHN